MCDPPIFSIPLKNPKSQQKSLGLNIQTPPSHKLVVISVVVMTRYLISTGPKLCPHATHPPGTLVQGHSLFPIAPQQFLRQCWSPLDMCIPPSSSVSPQVFMGQQLEKTIQTRYIIFIIPPNSSPSLNTILIYCFF